MRRLLLAFALATAQPPLGIHEARADSEDWPRFRGPNGQGTSDTARPPITFGPSTHLAWRTPVGAGLSSPCISGDRIFLTSATDQRLETLALRRRDGSVLWRRSVDLDRKPRRHRLNHPASSTPATDGRHVVVFCGAFGLVGYDVDGKELWRKPIPNSKSYNGDSASPLLTGGKVVLNCDWEKGSFLTALDAATGETAWTTPRKRFMSGYATPALLDRGTHTEIVVPGSLWLAAYHLHDGRELWTCNELVGIAVVSSPALGDGMVFASALSESFAVLDPWATLLRKYDVNHDGRLETAEIRSDDPKEQETAEVDRDALPAMDLDNDAYLTQDEYEVFLRRSAPGLGNLFAVVPGTKGEVPAEHVRWRYRRGLSRVTSPLFYQGRLYMVTNGGLLTCLEARTGRPLFEQERLGAEGDYHASPVAADGRIYVCSTRGVVTVVQAGDSLQVLARNVIEDGIHATPALVGEHLYVRTGQHLWAFGPGAHPHPPE